MKRILFYTLLFIASISFSFSQGTLTGRVTDNNGELLIGVKLLAVEDFTITTRTDLDGKYTLKFPNDKVYTIKVLMIGYDTIITKIDVKKSEVITKDFTLTEFKKVKEIKELSVVGKRNKANDYYMEKIKLNSATSIDYISSETMKKTGDANVTAAITRVSGVSSNGGLITVRGIGDRYVKTTLNGSRIPTLDPLTNNIKLEIFPTSLIDNIVITKTASPELPGDWAGAYISVETKDYPDKLNLNIETQIGYNAQNTFKDYITSDKSETDWLGFDNGFREHNTGNLTMPNLAPTSYQEMVALGLGSYFNQIGVNGWTDGTSNSNLYFRMGLVQLGLLSASQINDNASYQNALQLYNSNYKNEAFEKLNPNGTSYNNGFNNNWATKLRKAPMNFSNSFSIGDQKLLFGKKFGYFVGFKYGSSIRYDSQGVSQRVGDESLNYSLEIQDSALISRETNSWSAICNLALKLNDNNKLSFLFMPNFTGNNDVSKYETQKLNNVEDINVTQNIFYEQRQQLIYQLASQNYIPSLKMKLDFNASYTAGKSVAPDFKATEYLYILQNGAIQGYQFSPTAGDGIRRFDRYLTENILDSRIIAELPLSSTKNKFLRKLKFGAATQYNYKKTDNDEYRVMNGNNLSQVQLTNNDINSYLSPDKFIINNGILDYSYQPFDFLRNHSFGYSNVIAGFAMTDFELNKAIRFSGGFRIEHTNIFTDVDYFHKMGYERNDIRRENLGGFAFVNAASISETDFLPSANIIYKIFLKKSFDSKLRFNFSKTLARPSLRELNDAAIFDNEFRTLIYGNSDLKIVDIYNYDFRSETYFKNGDNVSFSLFYKDLKNHIEMGFGSAGITWDNIENSSVKGLEIEGRKKLGKYFDIRANVTLVNSISEFVRRDFQVVDGIKVYTIVDTVYRTMFGQAPYLVNSIFSYVNDTIGLTATVSYNIQGPRLVIAGSIKGRPDVYEISRNMIDVKISKRLSKHFTANLTIRDILNTPVKRSYKLPSGWVDYDSFRYGVNFVLGISYKL
jgi:hypothetical protein